MFWNRCKSDTPITDAISKKYDAIKENEELKAENVKLKSRVEGLENMLEEINSEITAAKPILDFDTMRIFSIERHVNNNKPCTIIGFWVKEPVLSSDGEMIVEKDAHKEWYLYCNTERHTELVNDFVAWKAKK